jgi:hypothetical protein
LKLGRCWRAAMTGQSVEREKGYKGWVEGKYYNVMDVQDPGQCFLIPRSWWAVDECQRVRVQGLLAASPATMSVRDRYSSQC